MSITRYAVGGRFAKKTPECVEFCKDPLAPKSPASRRHEFCPIAEAHILHEQNRATPFMLIAMNPFFLLIAMKRPLCSFFVKGVGISLD
jgi:hypothetical protein